MFSKISRYKNLEEIVTVDPDGKMAESKALRLFPEVDGVFFHTVEEVDRLDHLAFKYYKQSRKWWRICDANPEMIFPQALLGKDPIVTFHFPLVIDSEAGEPLWANLLNVIRDTVGVQSVQIKKEAIGLVERIEVFEGDMVSLTVPEYWHTLIVIFNEMNLSSETLTETITSLSFTVGPPEKIGRVGKKIVIPRNILG